MPRLLALLADDATVLGPGPAGAAADPEVTGLAADSREAGPGCLFAALAGARADGAAFAAEAVRRGAVAVLGDARLAAAGLRVPVAVAADPRLALARAAARFFGAQPAVVAAVTGTNGKSSVASFARALWAGLGHRGASVGTLGVASPAGERPLGLTTPGPIELHGILAGLAAEGVTHAAIEASSHALDQRRVDGVRLRAAAFTNLTRDHFDYHGTAEAYLAAKARLFGDLLPAGAAAVLNADVPEFDGLAALCRARGVEVLDYGRAGRRLRLLDQRPAADGQRLLVEVDGRRAGVQSPLVGDFQAHNLLAAAGLALAAGARAADLLPLLGAVRGARGRMEAAGGLPNGAAIFVDYAHTPDALARALAAIRPHAGGAGTGAGRVAVVFGAGGDRDPGKRPLMGEAAARHADRVYVTDDNPRSEDPAAIRAAVLAGCGGRGIDAGDRRAAIFRAVAELGPGDVLVVAGKGHETGQTAAGRTAPFDDTAVVALALAAAPGGGAA